MLEKYYRALP